MSDTNTVEVRILDKDYLVACPPEQQGALKRAADHLDTKVREIRASGKIHGTERIIVMAALNLTYELMQNDASQTLGKTILDDLEGKLDKALANA